MSKFKMKYFGYLDVSRLDYDINKITCNATRLCPTFDVDYLHYNFYITE